MKKRKEMTKVKPEWNKKYTTIAVYTFIVLIAITLMIFAIIKFGVIKEFVTNIVSVLAPVIAGVIFAYLLNPLLDFFEFKVFKKVRAKKQYSKTRRGLSLFAVCLCVIIIIALMLVLLIPQLIESYNSLRNSFGTVDDAITSIVDFVKSNRFLEDNYDTILRLIGINPENGDSEIIEKVFEYIKEFSPAILNWVKNVASGVYNAVIAFIFCIYLLAYREKILATMRKIFRSLLKDSIYHKTSHILSITDHNFGGFIKGKLLDSAIIFVLAYIVYWCMGLRFYPILAFITGITNVIPFFGPFIGAVPVGFIVLIAQPEKLIWTLLAILIIQQIDGNFIGPMILGDSVGLSPVWIISSILVFSGLFGFYGMLFGVPLFATIYAIVKEYVETRLEKKELPVETELYYPHHQTHKIHIPQTANFQFVRKVVNKIKNVFTDKNDNTDSEKKDDGDKK